MISGWICIAWLCAIGVTGGYSCPQKCSCFKSTVRCIFLGLRQVPSGIGPETTVLDLRFNRIVQIDNNSFLNLPRLHTLLMNNNQLKSLGFGTLKNLYSLRTLYLYKNSLTRIESNSLLGLRNLQFLYLHHNHIGFIHPEAFHHTPKLKRLFLNSNNLNSVPYGAFESLNQLERLRLDSNSIVCDCKVLWLAKFSNDSGKLKNLEAQCAYPENMKGKLIANMTEQDLHCSFPKIMAEPNSVTVQYGETVYFLCKADGNPEPQIVWIHNSSEIKPADHRYSIMGDGTLMIENTKPEDLGFYECLAKNPAGTARTRRAELKYRREVYGVGTPRIIHPPRDIEVSPGTLMRLPCVTTGSPQPTVDWTHDGRLLSPNDNLEILSNGELIIRNLNQNHQGVYRCTARNQYGVAHVTANVYVKRRLDFVIKPTDQFVTEGTTVQLYCEVVGYPRPTITWLRRGHPLRENQRIQIDPLGTVLTITPFLRQDVDDYMCQASNNLETIRQAASIRIKPASSPRITTAPVGAVVKSGRTHVFTCAAEGEPKPKINWSFNGSPIPTIRGHYEITTDSSLYVHNVDLRDTGHYSCQAANDVGSMSADAKLIVEDDRVTQVVDQQLIHSSLQQARTSVDRAINATRSILFDGRPKSPHELFTLFRYPGPQAIELARARDIYEQTLNIIQQHVQRGLEFNLSEFSYENILSDAHLQLISQLSGCNVHREYKPCSDMCFHRKYRSYDGTCNNLQHQMWGASLTPFKRLMKPAYENGFNTPIGWDPSKLYNGHKKPSARFVSSNIVAAQGITADRQHSHMLMQWGQFIDHDFDFAVAGASVEQFQGGLDCKRACVNEPPCFNIEIPLGDARIREGRCMEFERNSAVCGSGETSIFMNAIMPREQINQITSYIDASNVYGSSEADALDLRDLFSDHGLLKFDVVSHAKKLYLPFNRHSPMDCRRNASAVHSVHCFLAGDYRANEQLGLLSMHTIFVREHNRIASELLTINPHWDGERIYQETRKIVGAQMQHITFAHWLPKVLGPTGMNYVQEYRGYNPDVDASVSNEFATAAFRFGHTLINPVLLRLNSTFQPIPEGNIPLHRAFFAPDRLLNEGGVDPLMRGMFASPAKQLKSDQFLNRELTEKLFIQAVDVALDLAALNVQRGRDHGLPGYFEWRRFCNLSVPTSWDDLNIAIQDRRLREKLQRVYGHPANIDPFVGALSEDVLPDAKIGPTFVCILADQFKRSRDGDRFWYESPGVFSQMQLAELKRVSLAKILCHNGDNIDRVQPDVFVYPGSDVSHYGSCADLPDLNLNVWQECCDVSDQCRSGSSSGAETPEPAEDNNHNSNDIEPVRRKRHANQYLKLASNPQKFIDKEMNMRLDSIEQLITQLKTTVTTLTAKTKTLETKLKLSKHFCFLDTVVRSDGDKWSENSCSSCECKLGQVWCTQLSCPTLSCQQPLKLPFLCCPVCPQ